MPSVAQSSRNSSGAPAWANKRVTPALLKIMIEFGDRRRHVQGNGDAARAPHAVHAGDVVETRRQEEGDALFRKVAPAAEQPGSEAVDARVDLAVAVRLGIVNERDALVAVGQMMKIVL